MLRRFQLFVRGLATNWVGTAGAVLTTSAFILFLFMEVLQLLGIVTNAYVGLISYMLLPALFILGLLLIPIGWGKYRRAAGRSTRELLSERFTPELVTPGKVYGSSLFGLIALLTMVNLLFLGAGGARMLHFMDEPVFCGTACHKVMHPEWATYQQSPHARVKCVDCHVGQGVKALMDAKLNGLRQIVSATFHLYERPIPTPVRNLRPARETCERCHWPEKFYGDRLKVFTHYALDEISTPRYTTLALRVGSGTGEQRGTIHWHIAAQNEVRYQPATLDRERMAWIEVCRSDGSLHRYGRTGSPESAGTTETPRPAEAALEARTLDCIDCHNRATHIYEDPEAAVDGRMAAGRLDRAIPFLKREALGALLGDYPTKKAAARGIAAEVQGTYARDFRRETAGLQPELGEAVDVLQEIYQRNIHPLMNVGWNPYPDHRGHRNGGGCFRCHNADLVDSNGVAISHECTLCHSILAYDSAEPFEFLLPAQERDPERRMHLYLQEEFLEAQR
jgi:nitrate/TMAO reductase-like tetraheme cytochrome c subunit